MDKKPVAIVTTIYKPNLSEDEQISIRHLNHHLGKYDKFALVPERSGLSLPGFQSIEFPAKYFTSAKANADLLFSFKFHETFRNYKYIMIYETDCLVFSDEMEYWVAKNYDYIGAPWIKKFMLKRYDFPDAVGNGGFALRKVEPFLKALEYGRRPWFCMRRELKNSWKNRNFKGLAGRLYDLWSNTPKRTKLIEDRWWAFKAKNYNPDFHVAPVAEGIRFAWEIAPREMMKLNGGKLPFGAHAWARYDREFWKPYLLKN